MNGQFPIGVISPWRYFLSLGFFVGCLFTLTSDTYDLPFWLHFIKWQFQVMSGLAFFILTHSLLTGVLAKAGEIIKLLISALIAVTLYTPVSLLVDVYIEREFTYTLSALMSEWGDMVPIALFTWVAINLPWLMGLSIQKQPKNEGVSGTHERESTLQVVESNDYKNNEAHIDLPKMSLDDVALESREAVNDVVKNENDLQQLNHFLKLSRIEQLDEVRCFKAELHYLRVITETQENLILYNLKDAIALIEAHLPQLEAGQTHRSYWVNRHYITRLIKKGREGCIVMSNGERVPVSRSNMNKVKQWV